MGFLLEIEELNVTDEWMGSGSLPPAAPAWSPVSVLRVPPFCPSPVSSSVRGDAVVDLPASLLEDIGWFLIG